MICSLSSRKRQYNYRLSLWSYPRESETSNRDSTSRQRKPPNRSSRRSRDHNYTRRVSLESNCEPLPATGDPNLHNAPTAIRYQEDGSEITQSSRIGQPGNSSSSGEFAPSPSHRLEDIWLIPPPLTSPSTAGPETGCDSTSARWLSQLRASPTELPALVSLNETMEYACDDSAQANTFYGQNQRDDYGWCEIDYFDLSPCLDDLDPAATVHSEHLLFNDEDMNRAETNDLFLRPRPGVSQINKRGSFEHSTSANTNLLSQEVVLRNSLCQQHVVDDFDPELTNKLRPREESRKAERRPRNLDAGTTIRYSARPTGWQRMYGVSNEDFLWYCRSCGTDWYYGTTPRCIQCECRADDYGWRVEL